MRIGPWLLIGIIFFLIPISAFANGLAIPGGPTPLDGVINIPADIATPPDATSIEISFASNLEPGRSYACTLLGSSKVASDLDIINVLDPSSTQTTLKFIGDSTPAIPGDAGDTNNNRVAIIPSGTGTQTAGAYQIYVANNTVSPGTSNPLAVSGRLDCLETTLYGGYNTNVNDFNFLEITNTTNVAVSGLITATNSDGTVVINKQPFSVQPNRRQDIDIHTPAGANKFGLIQVVHDGPFGALQAYVSQYDGNISNFVLTASIPLRPRDK